MQLRKIANDCLDRLKETHFPELRKRTIIYTETNSNLKAFAVFKLKSHYQINNNCRIFNWENLQIDKIAENVFTGLLAHELVHVLQYEFLPDNKPAIEGLAERICISSFVYWNIPQLRNWVERRTDLEVVNRGLGEYLAYGKRFVMDNGAKPNGLSPEIIEQTIGIPIGSSLQVRRKKEEYKHSALLDCLA